MFGRKDDSTEDGKKKPVYIPIPASCRCTKLKDTAPNPWRVDDLPEPYLRDKWGRDHGWAVMASWNDIKSKSFKFQCMKNADMSEIKDVPYADICKLYWWKSISFSKDGQHVYPKW